MTRKYLIKNSRFNRVKISRNARCNGTYKVTYNRIRTTRREV